MATVNGIGTMRYDWRRRSDGTAEATLWFVVFFFPVFPLRREHLRVLNMGIKRSGILSTLLAIGGAGVGFQTSIEVLGTTITSPWAILRTYFKGFIVVPFVTFVGPMMLMIFSMMTLDKLGVDIQKWFNKAMPVIGIAVLLWAACIIARILDRSAGRHHTDATPNAAEQSDARETSAQSVLNSHFTPRSP